MLAGAELDADGSTATVCFVPKRGYPPEIRDRLPLLPAGEMHTVNAVGRLIRILRAGRVAVPPDPYALGETPARAVELLLRCQGAALDLIVTRRIDRTITVWTETGVEEINGVLDYSEDAEGLLVQRRGGGRALRITRQSLIRFSPSSRESLKVISIEIPSR